MSAPSALLALSALLGAITLEGCKAPAPPGLGVELGGPCTTESDCGDAGSCASVACVAGRCETRFSPPGTPVSQDSPPDCKALVCGAGGVAIAVADPTNVPVPSGACLSTTCSDAGVATTGNAPFGKDCGAAGRCNGFGSCVGASPSDVLSHHNDNGRTGLQPAETFLTPANVNALQFGKAFTIPVDDDVYAQPLYVARADFGGTVHDALLVATMGDTIDAFDADSGQTLWETSLLQPGWSPLRSPFMLPYQAECTTITGNIGALATPAIDLAAGPHGTIFEIAESVDGQGAPQFHLHALDLTTGQERPGSPVAVAGVQVDGEGVGGDGMGHVVFDPTFQFSRLSLVVANGRVYFGFSSICDQGPFHGWLLAYDEQTLALASVFSVTPDTVAGGLWEGGDGPAVDEAGNVYVVTGNGPFDVAGGGRDYGDSILKMSPSLEVLDYFTPNDAATLWEDDLDLGSAGVLLVPGTSLLAHVSKTDTLRLLDSTHLGGYGPAGDPQIVQTLELGPSPTPASPTAQHQGQSNPVAWRSTGGVMVYFQTWQDPLRQYQLTGGQLNLVAVNNALMSFYPGAGLSVSADGSTGGTGIVWALMGSTLQQGTLMAFDAGNVESTLWSSPATDDWLYLVHTKPTIAGGRVYVPTGSREIVVYASR